MSTTNSTGPVSVEIPHVWMQLGDGPPVKVLDKDHAIGQHMFQGYRQCDAPAKEGV